MLILPMVHSSSLTSHVALTHLWFVSGLLLNLLTRYSNAIVATIDGTNSESITKTELTGGARVNFIFTQGV